MYQSIVVGTDGSETAGRAFTDARDLARAVGATLHVVSVSPDPSKQPSAARDEAQALVDGLAATIEGGVGHARNGDPAECLVAVADEVGADLLVVGNRGMRGPGRILGSVPNTLSHKAPCSVLIVRTN